MLQEYRIKMNLSLLRVTEFFHIAYTIDGMPRPVSQSQTQDLIKLGARVKAIREEKGLTLQQVADAIEKDRQSIHRLEKGDFNPSYIYLLEVSKGLGIDIAELFTVR